MSRWLCSAPSSALTKRREFVLQAHLLRHIELHFNCELRGLMQRDDRHSAPAAIAPSDNAVRGGAPEAKYIDFDLLNRSILFCVTLLVFWVSVHPFADPSAVAEVGAGDRGDTLIQVAFIILAGCCVGFCLSHDVHSFRPTITPMLVVMAAWLVVSTLLSQHPDLSTRRLVLQAIVFGIALLMVQLPRDIAHFGALLAGCTLFVLALCYVGILAEPTLSIHLPTDPIDTVAGWRGVFFHKNSAGAMMALFIYIGLFVARVNSAALGWSIIASAAVFLVFAEAKTAIALLLCVLPLSSLILAIGSRGGRTTASLGIVAGFSLITVGSVFFEPVRNVLETVLPDPTFTGRTYIWSFIGDYLPDYGVTGYGFSAFWGSSEVAYGLTNAPEFVPLLHSGHNSYLDLAITLGLPGVTLVLAWAVLEPMWGLLPAPRGSQPYLIQLLFIRIWLFGLTLSCFESVLLERNDPIWFTILLSIFGLHHLSRRAVS